MHDSHQLPERAGVPGWPLPRGAVLRLPIGPGPRCLRVGAGQVWLTHTAKALRHAPREADHWMTAGQQVLLNEGAEVVLEARDAASFELLVPPQACPAARLGWLHRAWHGARTWATNLAARARSAAPQARRAQRAMSGAASIA